MFQRKDCQTKHKHAICIMTFLSILPKSGSKRSEKLLLRFTGFTWTGFCSLFETGNKCSHLELSHGSENSV